MFHFRGAIVAQWERRFVYASVIGLISIERGKNILFHAFIFLASRCITHTQQSRQPSTFPIFLRILDALY